MSTHVQFTFRPQWKEELACECEFGVAMLDMPMGVTSVYLPSQHTWEEKAPDWAAPLWETFNAQVVAWAKECKIPMYPGMGSVYFKPAT